MKQGYPTGKGPPPGHRPAQRHMRILACDLTVGLTAV